MLNQRIVTLLRKSEKYTQTDMIYAVKGSFWIMLGKIGIFIIAFAKMIIFGRYLEQDVYGIYTFVISMAGIIAIFSLSGINTSLVKAIAKGKEGTLMVALKERLKFSTISSLLSFGVSGWYLFNGNEILGFSFLIVALLVPFHSSFNIFSSFWSGRKDFKTQNKYEFLSAFLVALAVIPIIIFTQNPVLIVLALYLSTSVFNGLFLAKTIKQKVSNETMPEAISFGKSLTVMGAIATFAGQLDKIIMWKFFGPVQLAIYSFALVPINQIRGIIPISALALPKIGEKSAKDMKQGIMAKFKKLFYLSIPLTVLTIVFAPLFYKIIIPQYVDSIPLFQAFSLLILLSPFALIKTSLLAEMKKRDLYIIDTATPLLKIALFVALIPFIGIWGVVGAIVLSEIAGGLLSLHFFRKI